MEASFWESRWTTERIGFHLGDTNPNLARWWPELHILTESRVLVPLCGKSLDLLWLHRRGHRVIGVELSAKACAAFFAENDLAFRQEVKGEHTRWIGVGDAEGLELLQGDFFHAPAELIGRVDALYDRASLIALPPALRPKHTAQLGKLLPTGARGLMITITYPQAEKAGPPFSVPTDELTERLASDFSVDALQTTDLLEAPEAANRWGLSSLIEVVHSVTRT